MTAESLDKTLHWFYHYKNIDDATFGLQYLLEHEDIQSVAILYSFGRIAALSPEANKAFRKLKENFSNNEFLAHIIHDPTNQMFSKPYQCSIEHPQDLDILWAELFVTGDIQPLQQIVSVLVRLAMKSAVVRSLTVNAESHDIVTDFCETEANCAGGAARLLLK